jgi:hypothetical protein
LDIVGVRADTEPDTDSNTEPNTDEGSDMESINRSTDFESYVITHDTEPDRVSDSRADERPVVWTDTESDSKSDRVSDSRADERTDYHVSDSRTNTETDAESYVGTHAKPDRESDDATAGVCVD